MPTPDTKRTIRLGVLISGTGRSLQNLIDRIDTGALAAEIGLVISSRKDAKGLDKAKAAGIPHEIVVRKDYQHVEEFSADFTRHLRTANVDLVVMAGFMVLWRIPDEFVGRVINIHPALIPDHCGKGLYGMRVHRSVIASGDRMSGCTVHFVDREYDHGPIISQRLIALDYDETAESLAARVFQLECDLLPEAIRMIADAEVRQENDTVVFNPKEL